ncbi:MAG: zinc-ribbon domain containing protein [Caulobacteraceae bacterium]
MAGDSFIQCSDCGQPFTFTAGERKFYESKGLYDPKRCPDCRKARKVWKAKIEKEGKKA